MLPLRSPAMMTWTALLWSWAAAGMSDAFTAAQIFR